MNILVLGGTRFFGVHLVNDLIRAGHHVTIATRGNKGDNFGNYVNRIIVDHTDLENMQAVFAGKIFDVVYDNLVYSSNDLRYALETIKCKRYIMTSSALVYTLKVDTTEEEFNHKNIEFKWSHRQDCSYDEGKRQAEYALFEEYKEQNSVAVRLPFVLGEDDYTERLDFYVNHVIKQIPMWIDNIDNQMSFISASDSGMLLAYMAESDYCGCVNGSSAGTMSLKEMISYIENKTNMKAIITMEGENAPYNGTNEYSINTKRAEEIGVVFSKLEDWIYELLDYYIEKNISDF